MKLLSILTAIISLFVFSSCESEQAKLEEQAVAETAKLEKQLIGKWKHLTLDMGSPYDYFFNEGGTGLTTRPNRGEDGRFEIIYEDLEWSIGKVDDEKEWSIFIQKSGEETVEIARPNGLLIEIGRGRSRYEKVE